MSEAFKTLNNIRSLRVLARESSIEQLEALSEKLALVIEEKRAEVKLVELQQAKRFEELNKYKALLEQDGISTEELVAFLGLNTEHKKRESRTRPAKYKYINHLGIEKTWTGQGRMPLAIQQHVDAGNSLSDFEI